MNIASLRERISRIEGAQTAFSPRQTSRAGLWTFGIAALDAALPDRVMADRALHDFTPDNPVNLPSVSAFTRALLQRLPRQGPILWCQTARDSREFGRPYGPGLLDGNPGPERFVFVCLEKPALMAFVLEEALKMPHLAAVLGEGPQLSFTETRRLSLIAQRSGVPCLFINTRLSGEASAAVTRWKVGPLAGPSSPYDESAPGILAWSLELTRSRSGKPGSWEVFWNEHTDSFDTVSASGHGAFRPLQIPQQRKAARSASG